MNIARGAWLLILMILVVPVCTAAPQDPYSDRCVKYIEQFKDLAMMEQMRYGVPAAITLGQGILETDAGTSELMLNANNHFGIKCRKEWTGETILHTDDAPNECFRKYKQAEDSYKDHSEYLKTSPRYAMLFQLQQTDYAGWARGLKRCGYATSPTYAQRLIKVIEDFNLQTYTYLAIKGGPTYEKMLHPEVVPTHDAPKKTIAATIKSIPEPVIENTDTIYFGKRKQLADASVKSADTMAHAVHKSDAPKQEPIIASVVRVDSVKPLVPKAKANDTGMFMYNGLRAVHAHEGDVLLPIAMKYNIRYPRLLEINDLPDAPLEKNLIIFLDKKYPKGVHYSHVVKEGETFIEVAQSECVTMRALKEYNMVTADGEPAAGTVLHLQDYAVNRPSLIRSARSSVNTSTLMPVSNPQSGYISKSAIDSQKRAAIVPAVIETKVASKKETPTIHTIAASTVATEPVNEMDELKAKMDKLVYAKDKDKRATDVASIEGKQAPVASTKVVTTNEPFKKLNSATRYHTVKKGDTAYSIAKENSISVKQLMEWNSLDFSEIKIGQCLQVTP
ncbi:MAG: glucosaminidase domain-containing protein [Bacteroidota bacterium]